MPDAPPGYYPRAGYRLAGERAIRIDMLERLADMTRNLDARAGFEASPEMLSITGLSLEQFAKLMQGLGYAATEGTRPKRRPAPRCRRPGRSDRRPAGRRRRGPRGAGRDRGEPEPDLPEPEIPVPADPDVPEPQPADVPEPVEPDVPFEKPTAGEPEPDLPEPEIPVPADPDVPEPQPADVPEPVEPDVPFEEPTEVPDPGPVPPEVPTPDPMAEAPEETEVFYLFTRGRRPEPAGRRSRDEARGAARERQGEGRKDKPRRPPKEERDKQRAKDGGKPRGKPADRPAAEARPPREKPIDPDNPFAALMALKLRS